MIYQEHAFIATSDITRAKNTVVPTENAKFQEISVYFTNLRTGIQYRWVEAQWLKSFEGEYDSGHWRFDLDPL